MSVLKTQEKLKQPRDLYFCCSIFTFVGLAYYGMKLVLLLFLAEQVSKGGLGLTPAESASMLASFLAWTYFSPVIGGWVSDRFLGPKNCIILGMLMVSIGYFLGYIANSKMDINIMIFLSGLGIGFYKGNLHTMVGNLYTNDDPRKDGAFSITYMATNLGTLFGPLICGLVANEWFAMKSGLSISMYGYRYVFLFSSITVLIGLFFFIFGNRKFYKPLNNDPINGRESIRKSLEYKKMLASRPLTLIEKKRIIVILVLAFFTVFFWIAYNQASMSIALYTKEHINLTVGNFQIPTSWIDSYNGLLCVILGPISALVWVKLSQTKKGDLSVPKKMSLGFILLAIAFLFMIVAVIQTGTDPNSIHKASVFWVVGFLTFQSIGEICFSPVGYGMVNKLSPEKYISFLMGVWFLGKFAANKLSGYTQAIIDQLGMLQVFIVIPSFLLIFGIILLIINKKLVELSN
ncbi:TPA: peptide MFS transporter [Clostridioides difficile]|uniref:peptide MFS transporter n=1 Tax=Clostridioides difficile TaxID=1496 RepID=UPI0003113F89|nr:peptide MFS transporter [Clostridioides difficile]EGT2229984.1 MFS transporter [Clostridioides difficile]EGT4166899.1 MFS transporter [Clostridioides difficile]EGT4249023.1 MFS transporter [Clostridioides difficile]EGT4522200.1 MFS transporter [Clostridioides difficile]EGT4638597.1 MFS transporter [Clostridioides difficile]